MAEFIITTHRKGTAKDCDSPYLSTVARGYKQYLQSMENVYDEPT